MTSLADRIRARSLGIELDEPRLLGLLKTYEGMMKIQDHAIARIERERNRLHSRWVWTFAALLLVLVTWGVREMSR